MKLFPSQSFVLHADISAHEAWDNLSGALLKDPKRPLYFIFGNPDHVPFKGYINGSRFNISRNLSYRNSFQAEISGEIFAESSGCKIAIRLSLMPFVKGFLMLWCSFAAMFFLMFISGAIKNQEPKLAFGSLFALGMIGFCSLIVSIGFKSDCNACRKALNAVFKIEM
ncbi:hypothetical protein SAMN05421827_10354 [Pedobacter terrae]|uniref:Uncharacterized protein n=1 Tax=Pedobacter terrae TaxID=405671 RepID=A0A1G7R3E9_9SPHI|nr:hypothetical protein [Pedobacter terrae]SDG05257.1 hypothetical protein SAMN05421827_10354 [Pedobacter terrae]